MHTIDYKKEILRIDLDIDKLREDIQESKFFLEYAEEELESKQAVRHWLYRKDDEVTSTE